jgi:DNA-binding CsgD family transcriptional regulator
MATALMTAVLIRLGAISLLKHTGLTANPLGVMSLLFKALKWMALGLGISAGLCVVSFSKTSQGNPGVQRTDTDASSKSPGFRVENSENASDWSMIARLVGLSATFTLLNSLLEMRLFPLVSGVVGAYGPFFLVVVPATLLLCFLVGRSRLFIGRTAGNFLRFLLMSMILLFILLPNLHFSQEYPTATLVMNSLVSIFHFSMWVILTTAVVELYRGRRWFYMCAVAVFMTHSVSFFGPFLGPFIPKGAAFTVLITATAAAVFALLGFRTLFPSLRLQEKPLPEPATAPAPSLAHIFREYGLTEREMEIAHLMIDGYTNGKIAERIFRTTVTVEKHITSIYRKFKVDNRVAFMAKFIDYGRKNDLGA